MDKKINAIKFQSVKDGSFSLFLETTLGLRRAFEESLSEVKGVHIVVKQVSAGIKKTASLKRRQEAYKVSKLARSLAAGGFCEVTARLLSKAASSPSPTSSEKLSPEMGTTIRREVENPEGVEFSYMARMLQSNAAKLSSETAAMLAVMKANAIMKPVALEPPQSPPKDLIETPAHDIMRPWLVLAKPFTQNWGPLKWPVQGLPCIVTATVDCVGLVLVEMSVIIQKGGSLEKADWFDGGDKVVEEDAQVIILGKGQSVEIPFGVAVLWAVMPPEGKESASPLGGLLVQWLLRATDKVVGNNAALSDMRLTFQRLVAAHGSKKPWMSIRERLTQYLTSLGE